MVAGKRTLATWRFVVQLLLALTTVALPTTLTSAQEFACSLAASDESNCVASKESSGNHCVWCSNGAALAFCVSESQAQGIEQSISGTACHRYSDKSSTATRTVKTSRIRTRQDATAESSVFDLQQQRQDPYDVSCALAFLQYTSQSGCESAKDHKGAHCKWCELQGMSFMCLTEEQASIGQAVGVTCTDPGMVLRRNEDDDDAVVVVAKETEEPYDPSCILAFYQDPTQGGCSNGQDADGNPCQWCHVAGLRNVCLTAEQAAIGSSLGITCGEVIAASYQEPMDPSCNLSFLQDPTKAACASSFDADKDHCQFCNFGGALDLCLTEEQAFLGKAIGITCDPFVDYSQILRNGEYYKTLFGGTDDHDPYDTACALAFWQDSTQEGCMAAVDEDGQYCEWCNFRGMGNLCLTKEQGNIGEALGITCEDAVTASITDYSCFVHDPGHPTCLHEYDMHHKPCVRCDVGFGESGVALCLTSEQAFIGSGINGRFACERAKDGSAISPAPVAKTVNPHDASCATAFRQNPNKEACMGSLDATGKACNYCTLNGQLELCLTAADAQVGETYGFECNSSTATA